MSHTTDFHTIQYAFPLDEAGEHTGVLSYYRRSVDSKLQVQILEPDKAFLGMIINLSGHILRYTIGDINDTLSKAQYNFFYIAPNSSLWELDTGLNSLLLVQCESDFLQQFIAEVPILEGFLANVAQQKCATLTGTNLPAPPEILDHIIELTREHQFTGTQRDGYIRAKSSNMLLVGLMNSQRRNDHVLDEVEANELQHLYQYMVENLKYLVDTRPLMSFMKLPEEELREKFKRLFGRSMYEALRCERLKKAEALLRNSDISIQEIAVKVGYGSLSALSYAFNLQYGMYPREYRQFYREGGRN